MNGLTVEKLDWTKLLMWNGSLYKLNKVLDFDSEMTESTKIEMIKVLEANSRNRRPIILPSKLPPLYIKKLQSPQGDTGTGVPVISGGSGNQVLKLSKAIQG